MRIGLLGGSFNPPHAAHRAISQFAIKRLQLDRVWWLVTPGNPAQGAGGLRELDERANAARKMADDPRIDVELLNPSSERATLRTRSAICAAAAPACALSGSWALTISRNFIAGRTGGASHRGADGGDRSSAAKLSRAGRARRAGARAVSHARKQDAGSLADRRAPAWVFLTGMKSTLSSTGLRNPDGSWATHTQELNLHHWNIETINPTCRSIVIGRRDSAFAIQ